MAEPEPKFNPFTGSGRRLDGRPLSYEPAPASSSKDKQPVVANGNGQSSVASSSEKAARQAQGKLVFGANTNRAPKEAPKVLMRTLLIHVNTETAMELRDKCITIVRSSLNFFFPGCSWKRDKTRGTREERRSQVPSFHWEEVFVEGLIKLAQSVSLLSLFMILSCCVL